MANNSRGQKILQMALADLGIESPSCAGDSYEEDAELRSELLDSENLKGSDSRLEFDENDYISSTDESNTSLIVPYAKNITVLQNHIPSDEDSLSNIAVLDNNPGVLSITQEIGSSYMPENTTCNNKKNYDDDDELTQNESNRTVFLPYIEAALKKQQKKRTVCKFCKISVTNFERHLCRHHTEEKEVQDYLKFPVNTKEGKQMRRKILALLRYETDFENFIENENLDSTKLPCSHCKRIIAANYLRRHYKKCIVKPINETGRNIRHQAASQTLVAFASEHANIATSLRVKNEVFTRMATDKIGFLARRDPLIRHYGEYYLKKHKRAQLSISCSNKMRECARLLIEIRRRLGKTTVSFFEMLDPILFDDVVLAAKAISGYNEDKKNYAAPSLAMHLGTTLQQVCELSMHLLLKRSTAFKCHNFEDRLKEIKRFRFLVETQWRNEVSSLASKDLAEKKWNKTVMLPLTKDIIKFRNHVLETANKSIALLKADNFDLKAFRQLVEASLAFAILFNRRRIGDVQYVEIDSYLKNFIPNNQTEFLEELTESEKALTASYKRVVAGGKGSRAIVILFPPLLQEYINFLLEIRNKTNIIPAHNKYLFAYPGVSDQWIRGDIVLKKFAKSSKIENPETMTSNKLRKQIATLMQIMNLDKNDYSQFSKFMGHTEKTHQDFYEITQDAYQTAKVAKLLSLFDQGKGQQYKNTLIKNIDIDPNQILADCDSGSEEDNVAPAISQSSNLQASNSQISSLQTSNSQTSSSVDDNFKCTSISKVKDTGKRVRWTTAQKKLVKSHFKTHIKNKKAPKKEECVQFLTKHKDVLHNLDWVRIKTFVYNTYTNQKD